MGILKYTIGRLGTQTLKGMTRAKYTSSSYFKKKKEKEKQKKWSQKNSSLSQEWLVE